ncbi:DDE superfamily endonuclease domain-containing protein [Ditylenchus destructor]|uniref:DDE superfamily endonuclease domain-containing protein n=1 Tax=Ditylenchus destructor TaxID=166010 RepID=A0AAD4NEQ6_9BILA|nr:DDE superfamily endonuclease domain-containing protein [Ditylenchus destructor]
MANYFDGVLDDELDLFPVGPSTSTESCESNNTTETTETAESMETAESSDTDVPEERVKTKAQKSCTVAKKLEILDHAKKSCIRAAARFFKVERKSIRNWMKNEPRYRRESLKVHGGEKKNLPGQGRHLVNSGFDGELASWIRQERALKGCCTQSVMLARAKVLAQRYDVGINLSHGWFQAFVERDKFSLRKTMRIAQKPPEDYVHKIVDFILYVGKKREKEGYARILAMDETAVQLEPASAKVLETKGAKDVTVISTGHEHTNITVALTARSDGKKLKPMVLLPRTRNVKAIDDKWGSKLHLVYAGIGKSWMNNQHIEAYLRKVIGNSMFQKTLLIWDSFKCHISEDTKRVLHELGIETAVVPPGCTKYIRRRTQTGITPSKPAFAESTKNGSISRIARTHQEETQGRPTWTCICAGFLKLGMRFLTKRLRNPNCAITTANDGSEDHKIACFRPTGAAPMGLDILRKAREESAIELIMPEEEDLEENILNGLDDMVID